MSTRPSGHDANDRRRGLRPAGVALLLVTTLVTFGAIWSDSTPLLRGPAPYPPEWRWWLREEPLSGRWLPLAVPILAWLLLLGLTATAAAHRHSRRTARLVLAAAILVGWGFGLGLLAQEPAGALRTLLAHTLSRTINSYYTVAISPQARDPRAFLAQHAELLPGFRKTAKHAATHPPGPVLFYRGLIALCEASPRLTSQTLSVASVEAAERPDSLHTPASRAAAILGGLLLGLLAAATAWPTAALARRLGCGELAAARVGLVWVMVPGPLLFTPLLDPALALPVTLATATLSAALAKETSTRASILLALAAGGVAGVALSFSYGTAVLLALGGLLALASSWRAGHSAPPARRVVAWSALGVLAILAVPAAFGHQVLQAARTALAIHQEVYTLPRSYWLWLLFNPLDLAVFLGTPLAILAAARSSASLEVAIRRGGAALSGADRFRLALAAGFGLLLLSGTLRGEGGRVLIPLMPLFVLAGLAPSEKGDNGDGPSATLAGILGLCLAALAFALRWRWQV